MECSLKNISIHYEVLGDGKPLIVLPGWSMNTRLMSHRIEPYFQQREGWKRIYIDPPGHGKTSDKDWIINQDKMLDVILACIDKLTDGNKFCILGSSLGAYLARGVLRYRAQLVDGIAMLVPVIIAEDEKRTVPPFNVLVENSALKDELSPFEADLYNMSVVHTDKWLDYLRDLPQVPEQENGNPEFLAKIREQPENYAFSFDVDNMVAPFSAPSLIIAGRQDAVVGYHDAWNILENYPRATYVVLDRAGHLMEEKAGVIQVLINEWLDRVEEYQAQHKY
jgi:pimeloyl-ACP methyl ester carboxylesterase